MFMSFGKSLGFGEIEGFDIYKCAWKKSSENVTKLKFSLTDP